MLQREFTSSEEIKMEVLPKGRIEKLNLKW